MLSYERHSKLDIVMQRRYLYDFLVETVVKVNIAPLYSVLLYYIQFGMSFVGQHFVIPKIHRFLEVSKF
jgi:hypothetical protein